MLQDGRQSQLRVTECEPETTPPQGAPALATIVHIDSGEAVAPQHSYAVLPDTGWEDFKEMLTELSFPAWVEQEGVGVVFSNRCETLNYRIGERAQREVRVALSGEFKREPIRVKGRRGQWIEVSASSHPLPFPSGSTQALPAYTLYVVCLPGQEVQRDRAVIDALLRCVLGGAQPDALSSLTPQQRTIYRLLMSNRTYKEIAGQLGVAHVTVRVQIAAMRKRLGPDKIPLLRQS